MKWERSVGHTFFERLVGMVRAFTDFQDYSELLIADLWCHKS